jgi:hypothetical protein
MMHIMRYAVFCAFSIPGTTPTSCSVFMLEVARSQNRTRDRAMEVAMRTQQERWLPPDQGWCEVNADGSFHDASGLSGGGAIMRDHNGGFVGGASHFFPSCP